MIFNQVLRTISRLTGWRFAALVLITRILAVIAVAWMTHQREFSNDISMHMGLVRHPFCVLLYTCPEWEQHPPFLPAMETILGYPLQMFLSDFLTLRIVMIVWETVLAALFFATLNALDLRDNRRAWCLLAFLLLPTGWITSAVMAQDDPIGACWFLLPLLLLARRQEKTSTFFSGLGFLAGKIFCAVELLGLVFSANRRNWLRNLVVGFAPIFLVYGGMAVQRKLHGFPLPLVGFKPDPYHGTNFWVVLKRWTGINLSTVGVYSGFLALLGCLIPSIIVHRLPVEKRSPAKLVGATAASLLIFYSLFYHMEPEYFLIVMPPLILTAEGVTDSICVVLIAVTPWLGKFFQNAAFLVNASVNSGKLVYSSLFYKIFRSSPESWLTADQLFFSVLTLYVSWRWCIKLLRKDENTNSGFIIDSSASTL